MDLSYYDQATGSRYRPYVIEPAAGVGRSMMAFLVDAYHEDEAPNAKGGVDKRTVLKLDPRLAPVKVAVLPLVRKDGQPELAGDLGLFGHVEEEVGVVGELLDPRQSVLVGVEARLEHAQGER